LFAELLLWQIAEKGSGRLNACLTKPCKLFDISGEIGGFACQLAPQQPFSATSLGSDSMN
jgi:hypothetical protein